MDDEHKSPLRNMTAGRRKGFTYDGMCTARGQRVVLVQRKRTTDQFRRPTADRTDACKNHKTKRFEPK